MRLFSQLFGALAMASAFQGGAIADCLLPPRDGRVIEATLLVGESDPDKKKIGTERLEAAAAKGDDHARICLAWLHVEGTVSNPSNKIAIRHLRNVGDGHKTAMLILLGAVSAKGGEGIPANTNKAKNYFTQAQQRLDSHFAALQGRKPDEPSYPEHALTIYYDYLMLGMYRQRYGIDQSP